MKHAWLSFILLCAAARGASAQSADPAAAEALFREGRTLSDAGDHAGACAKFRESSRLDPAVGTTFNIADCEERQGHLASAWTLFTEVVQRLPPNDPRRGIAEQRVKALAPRLPRLAVRLMAEAPAGTRVQRDGVELGAASLGSELPLDPGDHVVRVSAPGRAARDYRFTLREAEVRALDVEPGLPAAAKPGAPSQTAPSDGSAQKTAGYVIGAVGVAGLLTSAIAGYLLLDAKSTVDSDCDTDKRCSQEGLDAAESGKTFGVVTTIGLAVGAVGLGAGSYLVLSASPDEERGSASVLVGGRF
jgi:hypothetical protein